MPPWALLVYLRPMKPRRFSYYCAYSVYLAFISLGLRAHAEQAPEGFGQLENAPKIIPGGTDKEGRDYSYIGQLATKQKIILTASNGFFSKRTCQAKGESKLPKVGDEELITPNFEYLDWKLAEGSLRWHILVKSPGLIRFNAYLETATGHSTIEVSFAGQTKTVSTSRSKPDSIQPWDMAFDVKQPGEYMLSLSASKVGGSGGIGRLHRIDAFGPGIENAHLLRVRWRPAAVHGGYDTAKASGAKLLVFTTRSTTGISSYSPITTPFGYYGTSFDDDRRSNGAFNFSMWGKKSASTDLKIMPHLLGVGSAEGEFSGFGHEGSGVKPRGWDPMPDRPELVVQALRLVPGEHYNSYYGYYFDHPTNTWKFYGAGNKWHDGKPNEHLKLGSFCEVPGPPQSERSGDIYREVRRRAWSFDDGKWLALEQYNASGTGSKGGQPVNKSWFTTNAGEYAMGCGGIRLYTHKDSLIKPGGTDELPYFLTNPSLQNIFTMPIEYGRIQASEVAANRATIEIDIPSGNELKNGAVYFGTADALTFAPRELHGTEKNSELSKSINAMSWQKVVEVPSAQLGVNQATLTDLEAGTTYYYRVLMNNSTSRIWNNETLTFTTPKAGEAPIKLTPLIASKSPLKHAPSQTGVKQITGEAIRIWSYSAGTAGRVRKIEGRLIAIAGDKIQIERKSDGKKGTMNLKLFSDEDKTYVASKR